MQYTVIQEDSPDALATQVNNWIAEGWMPLGGVATAGYTWENMRDGGTDSSAWFVQAMTKA